MVDQIYHCPNNKDFLSIRFFEQSHYRIEFLFKISLSDEFLKFIKWCLSKDFHHWNLRKPSSPKYLIINTTIPLRLVDLRYLVNLFFIQVTQEAIFSVLHISRCSEQQDFLLRKTQPFYLSFLFIVMSCHLRRYTKILGDFL
jgi:hypothetical protein